MTQTTTPIPAARVYQTFAIPGTPADLLAGMTPLAQQNLSTPFLAAEVAAAAAAPGDVFLDTEIDCESGNVNAWGQNLLGAVRQIHSIAPAKRIGLFCLPMGSNANPYWQVIYPPMMQAARAAKEGGCLHGIAWAALNLYCDPAAMADHVKQVRWYNAIISQLAQIKASGLKPFAFLSPYDLGGNPVNPTLFGEACILARGLLDAGDVAGVNLWAWRTAAWDGDAAAQIGQFRQFVMG